MWASATAATQLHLWMWPNATPASKVDVRKCHTCHANGKSMSPSATPATQMERQCPPSATPATQMEGQCHQVPHLPRKTKVNVAKCHACQANGRSMSPNATPATQMEHQCHQVARLPRKVARRPGQPRPSAPPNPAQCHKGHPCHAKGRGFAWTFAFFSLVRLILVRLELWFCVWFWITIVEPVEPVEPVELVEPVEPVEPVELEPEPVEPVEPLEPVEPVEAGTCGNADPTSATRDTTLPEARQTLAPESVFTHDFTRFHTVALLCCSHTRTWWCSLDDMMKRLRLDIRP